MKGENAATDRGDQLPARAEESSINSRGLLADIRHVIDDARQAVAATANAALTMLHWRIGKRIDTEILKGERAEYGKEILATLSQELEADYGRGFSYSVLTRMVKFVVAFPDERIVVALSRQLVSLLCRVERWNGGALRQGTGLRWETARLDPRGVRCTLTVTKPAKPLPAWECSNRRVALFWGGTTHA